VGEKEQESQSLSVRKHGEGDLGSLSVEEFHERFKTETQVIEDFA
jgi:threonyl-tRNA synthetase